MASKTGNGESDCWDYPPVLAFSATQHAPQWPCTLLLLVLEPKAAGEQN